MLNWTKKKYSTFCLCKYVFLKFKVDVLRDFTTTNIHWWEASYARIENPLKLGKFSCEVLLQVWLSILIFSKDTFNVNATFTRCNIQAPSPSQRECGWVPTLEVSGIWILEKLTPPNAAHCRRDIESQEASGKKVWRSGDGDSDGGKGCKKISQFQLPTRLRSLHIPSTPWEIAKRFARSPEPQPCTSPKAKQHAASFRDVRRWKSFGSLLLPRRKFTSEICARVLLTYVHLIFSFLYLQRWFSFEPR